MIPCAQRLVERAVLQERERGLFVQQLLADVCALSGAWSRSPQEGDRQQHHATEAIEETHRIE